MKDYNTLQYISEKYNDAALFLAKESGSRGKALAKLYAKGFTTRFMEPGHFFNFIPESCEPYFAFLRKEYTKISKKLEEERNKFVEKYPSLKKEVMIDITIRTILSNLRSPRTDRIITNILMIAFELNCLKEEAHRELLLKQRKSKE